jgi:hypothetical protein
LLFEGKLLTAKNAKERRKPASMLGLADCGFRFLDF